MSHTSNARFDPSRRDPRMAKPDWAIAASYGPAWAYPPRRWEPWGARHPVPIGGRWRFAVGGRDRPATHAWACVASSLRCGSDRRLCVRVPAQAGRRRSGGQAAGCRVTSVAVKTRRCAGASCSTCWGNRRRRRVTPTSSGFDYPDDTAKAGTRVRVAESGGWGTYPETGYHRVVCVVQRVLGGRRRCRVAPTSSGCEYSGDEAKSGTRVRVCRHGVIPCFLAHAQVEA